MTETATPVKSNTPAINPLTVDQVKALLRSGSIILWPYREGVEEGYVLSLGETSVAVSWLEGYRSRNDDVPYDQVLSIHNSRAPEHTCGLFSGRGFLTQAGVRWIAEDEAKKARSQEQ